MIKSAIITGATSFIGRALINLLLENECTILAIVRPNSERLNLLPESPYLKIIEKQLYELEQINNKDDEKYDFFFHIGWVSDFPEGRNNYEGQKQNLKYNVEAVKLANRFHCEAFLSVGSQAECGRVQTKISPTTIDNPENAYGAIKCEAYKQTRDLCEQLHIRQLWPRLLSAYGEGDQSKTLVMTCLNACKQKKEIELTPCEQIWDYVYVTDVARALICIAQKGKHGKKYTIASGEAKPLKDYVKIITDITGYKELINSIGKKPYTDRQVMYLWGDIDETFDDTGFVPIYNFEKGIKTIIKNN